MLYTIVKRPNPIKPEDEPKFYATPSISEEVGLDDISKEISEACTVSAADVRAVVEALVQKVPFYLRKGFSIRLDRLGIFRLSFSSKGQLLEKDVSAADITDVRVLFRPCIQLKRSLEGVSFSKR